LNIHISPNLYYDLASSPADDGNIDCDDSEYGLILPSSFLSVLPTTDSLTFSEPVSVDVVQEKRHFLTSSPLVRRLRDDGILPLLKFPTSEGGSLEIGFGPLLDVTHNPVPPGTCLLSTTVY
jgi:hypothetical protein